LVAERVVTKPTFVNLALEHQEAIARLIGAVPVDAPWSHQLRVAEGQADLCVWFCGDVWDHAAPSIIVEEAGGRFTDLAGGKRLDSRTAIYSNGATHDVALAALLVT
jgi:fructose-1,6-bisphosphatase/inositol monophosphatase family enzyme